MRVIALFLVACSSQLPPEHPCHERNPGYLALVASCVARVQAECADIPDEECPVVRECDLALEGRCRE